jgi:hypothetical protein
MADEELKWDDLRYFMGAVRAGKAARKEAKHLKKASRRLPSSAGVLTAEPLERGVQNRQASAQPPSRTCMREVWPSP